MAPTSKEDFVDLLSRFGEVPLLMGKTRRVPVVIARGLDLPEVAAGTGQELVRRSELDLFR